MPLPREIHDHYFREAKREGYRSRAAYKLMEIDDRRRLLRHGDRVLDLGCAPGSWMQVAAKRVGRSGVVVGVDLKPLTPPPHEPNAHALVGDVREIDAAVLLDRLERREGKPHRFDVVISDLAPNTTGDRTTDHHASVRLAEAVLDRCRELLRNGGHMIIKVLEGEAYPDLIERSRRRFERVKGFKPKASRTTSTEMYIVAQRYRGPEADTPPEPEATAEVRLPPRRKAPAPGWHSGR